MAPDADSPAAHVAMLQLHYERDIPGQARARHPDLTDEQLDAFLARARKLDAAAYVLCERGPDNRPIRDNPEILAELAREFPEYPPDVLSRALNNGHYQQFRG